MRWGHYLPNPNSRLDRDIADALDHMQDLSEAPLRLKDFEVVGPVATPIGELDQYDDIAPWAPWDRGELIRMAAEERRAELEGFRGTEWAARASRWTSQTVPPIIVVDSPEIVGIGDGRGRVSYAIGMGWKTIPVVFLKK